MAGVSVDTGGGKGKRAVDSELNLIPMIDLMIVCISFLLITAVWSQMSRIDANANVPGQNSELPPKTEEADKMLTVEMKNDDNFLLSWKSGGTVHVTAEVPRHGVPVSTGSASEIRYPDLAKEIAKQWEANGSHRNDDDRVQDQAILAVDNRTPFSDVVAVIDAIYQPKRTFKGSEINAFNVTFATR